jgi:hypothetical protein
MQYLTQEQLDELKQFDIPTIVAAANAEFTKKKLKTGACTGK